MPRFVTKAPCGRLMSLRVQVSDPTNLDARADALYEPWLRPARVDVPGASVEAALANEAASVGVHQ